MDLNHTNVLVVKVGTSTLTHENGKLNLRRVEMLCRVLSNLQNSGKKIVLVSSGAVGVGMGKIGLETCPRGTAKKQALAAIGQCELMFIYDKFFGEYNQNVAQVLLTADVVSETERSHNVINTFNELLDMNTGKCRMAVAAKNGFVDNTQRTLRVATKFANIAAQYYRSKGRDIDIIHLNGSIELAPILDLSDVIVDIVETGTTLKENNLIVYETIVPISARLIANKSSYQFKDETIERLVRELAQLTEA